MQQKGIYARETLLEQCEMRKQFQLNEDIKRVFTDLLLNIQQTRVDAKNLIKSFVKLLPGTKFNTWLHVTKNRFLFPYHIYVTRYSQTIIFFRIT